ncbi:45 kDa calcium-binding protein-like [Pollicipes pollicipes]|uniref:45 kDa calcium-binding protein-like n=1 Tax=Pollicipes pollicipes TaxID=41117 RepID=UPI001884A842|nr:45 kDa calcium-binding protein-like [Pollicipes pollicipes]
MESTSLVISVKETQHNQYQAMAAMKSRRVFILYIIFVVYVTVVMLFIASMLFRSATSKNDGVKGLPRYMNEEEVGMVKIRGDGTLNEQLKIAFEKSDDNNDGYLEEQELADWIQTKVSEHITVGVKENFKVFLKLDKNPKDGWVSLAEYVALFLSSRGAKTEKELKREVKEQLMREKAEFFEIANEQNRLTIDELLRFRHPESSHAMILERVTQLIDTLDQDGDGALSEEELLLLCDPAYRPSDEETALFPVKSKQQMKALHTQLDLNPDKQLDQHEILVFVDPRHGYHATSDARRLLQLADADGDGALTLTEVQRHARPFRVIVDARHKFHQPEDRR